MSAGKVNVLKSQRQAIGYKMEDYTVFNFTTKRGSKQMGVYLINDCYIGASFDIRNRISNHLYQILHKEHTNKFLQNSFIEKGKLHISLLSENPFDEEYYTIKHGIQVGKNTSYFHQTHVITTIKKIGKECYTILQSTRKQL